MESATSDRIDEASAAFLSQWSRLVSTTNWEKGRIIFQWREALIAAGAPALEYSDDAWSRRVGSVTGQHVGRLRRVYERFGEVHRDYEGLYWSHFQAAIDWNDAEMWLEGAIQNRWSVADMRRERWQAFGGVESEQPHDDELVTAELDEDAESTESYSSPPIAGANDTGGPSFAYEAPGSRHNDADFGDESGAQNGQAATSSVEARERENDQPAAPFRPFADLPALPDDLSEAFESFKLAILRHKTAGWQEVTAGDVLRSLDALKTLAIAPA